MYGSEMLTKQQIECLNMFKLFDAGAHEVALLKTNVKKHEYILYGGRPEVYPEDRKAMLTLLGFKNEKIDKDRKQMEKQEEMRQRMMEAKGR